MKTEDVFNWNSNLTKLEKSLFEVVAKPLIVEDPKFINPNGFGIYKGSGGDPLGMVGKDFSPTQPKALFNALVPCLVDNDIDTSKLEYHSFKGGKKISFRAPVKMISFTNLKGEEDASMLHLNLATGFDGYTKTSMYLSLYRLVCSNGMKAWKTEFSASFKNTHGNQHNIQMLCNDVAKSIASIENLETMILRLNAVKFTKKTKTEFLTKVLGYDASVPIEEMHALRRPTHEAIEFSIAKEVKRTGATFWGLVNGITYFTNHMNNAKDTQDYLYTGVGEQMNNKAQKVALEMCK